MQLASNRAHRGEAVVNVVLEATREELARGGYRALRIEDVAARANVARTTIYRRWPTKIELVRDTLQMMFDVPDGEPDTGSLEGDLRAIATRMLRFLSSANGQVLVRMVMAEGAEPELRALIDSLRCEKDAAIRTVFERAKARGELRPNIPVNVVVSSMVGGLHHRIFAAGEDPATIDLEEHVALILHGVATR